MVNIRYIFRNEAKGIELEASYLDVLRHSEQWLDISETSVRKLKMGWRPEVNGWVCLCKLNNQ